jgi:hypothetical protein
LPAYGRFVENCRRVVYWLPTIWNDEWHDYSYLIRILEKKLRYDAKQYKKYGHSTISHKQAREMRIAACLCSRISKDNYSSPWDKRVITEMEKWSWNHIGENEIFYLRLSFNHQDYLRCQDKDYLFRILSKRLFDWWD